MGSVQVEENTVVESLKYIMFKKNTNPHQLAKKMGWDSQRLYKKFNHGKITLEDLDAIAKGLDVKCDIIFTMDDEKEDSTNESTGE